MGRTTRTAILMSDNRPPTLTAKLTYPTLAFALNALYACEHGYDLLYYQMRSSDCVHETQGVRLASYCKLPAIAHALGHYDVVAFIDSDSFFTRRNLTLPAVLQQYMPPLTHRPARPAVWFANDLPQLGERPNGGFHVWYRGGEATRLLRTWWHLPAGRYAREHDYEQHALQWSLLPLQDAVPLVGTLQMHAMGYRSGHAVSHVDHTKSEQRLWVMAVEILRAAVERGPPRSTRRAAVGEVSYEQLRWLHEQCRGVPSDAPPPSALLARVLHGAAALLRAGLGGRTSGLLAGDGTDGSSSARCRSGEGGFASDGRHDAADGRGTLRVYAYNASATARSHLGGVRTVDGGLLGAEGLPLVLTPCRTGAVSASASHMQEWAMRIGRHARSDASDL